MKSTHLRQEGCCCYVIGSHNALCVRGAVGMDVIDGLQLGSSVSNLASLVNLKAG